MVRFNADVDDELAKRLRHALVDEGITFAEWLRRQIDDYLAAMEPKGKKRELTPRESSEEAVARLTGLGRRRIVLPQGKADKAVQKAKGHAGKEG